MVHMASQLPAGSLIVLVGETCRIAAEQLQATSPATSDDGELEAKWRLVHAGHSFIALLS
jgi:hypothetical protein